MSCLSVEELYRIIWILQAEEDELMMQHFISSENTAQVQQKIRPYVDQVLMVRMLVCSIYLFDLYPPTI